MRIDGNMEYAATRVQSRFGQFPNELTWRKLEAARQLEPFLDAVRAGSLASWVSTFEGTRDMHFIERALRSTWVSHVESVAAWHPSEWQDWLAWLAWIPLLSLVAQLARPEPAPAWMLSDPYCGPIAAHDFAERGAALRLTPLAPLEAAFAGRSTVAAAWSAQWHALAPGAEMESRQLMSALNRAFELHCMALATASDSFAPRAQLAGRLHRYFRAGSGTGVAAACYLGLLALELERLRGDLVTRSVFTAQPGETG